MKDSLSSGTAFTFIYIASPTADLERKAKSQLSDAKRRSSSGYETQPFARKRPPQAVEANLTSGDPSLMPPDLTPDGSEPAASTSSRGNTNLGSRTTLIAPADSGTEFHWQEGNDQCIEGNADGPRHPQTSLSSGTAFKFTKFIMWTPTPTADLKREAKSRLSGGGPIKRRSSSGYETQPYARKRQAVEANLTSGDPSLTVPDLTSDASGSEPASTSSSGNTNLGSGTTLIAPADSGTSMSSPVERTEALPSIEWISNLRRPGQDITANQFIQHDVQNNQGFAPSMSGAPEDTYICSVTPSMLIAPVDSGTSMSSPVERTEALPFIEWLFDPRHLGQDITSAPPGGNTDLAWNEETCNDISLEDSYWTEWFMFPTE